MLPQLLLECILIKLIKYIKIENNLQIRLDKFLKINYTSLTQSFIEKNIRKNNILINNNKTKSKYIIQKNDILKICNFHKDIYKNKIVFKKKIIVSKANLIKFNKSIIFENSDFLIIDKWSNIATQSGTKINTSIDDIIKTISLENKLVHRLDKDTSGLLIISKNQNTAKIFGNLFKSRLIDKTYLAICEGIPKLKNSIVNLDIKNKEGKINKTKTICKLLDNYDGLSFMLFKPMTGKTHQIRIVAKNLSCPIVGDSKYNNQTKFSKEILKLNAHILKFTFKNKNYDIFANLPIDFKRFLKKNNLKNIKIST